MNTQETLKNYISQILQNLGIANPEVDFEYPNIMTNGDLATNVAMRYWSRDMQESFPRDSRKNLKVVIQYDINDIELNFSKPIDFALYIKSELEKINLPFLKDISVALPGFINFFFSKEFFVENIANLERVLDGTHIHAGKKILVEHSSPNLFKPFHIGHMMNNTVGESIVRLAKYSGAEVISMSYPSDVSLGIGKAVWSWIHKGSSNLQEFSTIEEKLAFLGGCYVDGTKSFEEGEEIQKEVRDITRKIYQKEAGAELDLYNLGKEINLEYFKAQALRLGSHFDSFIFESEAGEKGMQIVGENIGKVFEKSDGAIIFDGESRGSHTRVFVNSEGFPTYEAKDIGLLFLKFERFAPDISILITDTEQASYYKVVLEAASEIQKEWKEKTIHRTHGRMTFKGQKMSSRLGGVPLASEVLETVGQEAQLKMEGEGDTKKLDTIAIAALKFAILKSAPGKNIDFDPETSLSFEGDSGPYLQYTFARCRSILEKAGELSMDISRENTGKEILDLERLLCRFHSSVAKSISLWESHHTAVYLLTLAHEFNSWYASVKILDKENPEYSYNLFLVEKVSQVLKTGLECLGIETLEKM